MSNTKEISAEVLTVDGVTLCKQTQIVMTTDTRGTGEADIWRGTVAIGLCQRSPELGETLVLRSSELVQEIVWSKYTTRSFTSGQRASLEANIGGDDR